MQLRGGVGSAACLLPRRRAWRSAGVIHGNNNANCKSSVVRQPPASCDLGEAAGTGCQGPLLGRAGAGRGGAPAVIVVHGWSARVKFEAPVDTNDYCFRKNGMRVVNKHFSDWCRQAGRNRMNGAAKQA